MTDPKTKRRWLRFSLRTFLIVVTAFGGWLGWNFYEVRERARWVDSLRANKAYVYSFSADEAVPPWKLTRMSKLWRLFGGQAIRKIDLSGTHFGLRDAKVIADWFPEAEARVK